MEKTTKILEKKEIKKEVNKNLPLPCPFCAAKVEVSHADSPKRTIIRHPVQQFTDLSKVCPLNGLSFHRPLDVWNRREVER